MKKTAKAPRRPAEAKLAWLASFPDNNPNPVLEVEPVTGSLSYINNAARRLFPDLETAGAAHPFLAGLPSAVEALLADPSAPVGREVVVGASCYTQTISNVPDSRYLRVYAIDITERKRLDQERNITVEFLHIASEAKTTSDLVRAAAAFFQKQSGCQAVGIRLKQGEDYPYYETRGFPPAFVLAENSLCSRDRSGAIVRDSAGYPVHECMCGNVICGQFDPTKPFFTVRGSFWTNGTTELLATTTDADRQARTRNRCNGEGYESVALVRLHLGDQCLGLLQLNDRRKGMFSFQQIRLWEILADYLAPVLAKLQAEEALRDSERQFRTLADTIPNLAWWANGDGYITWYNRRWYEYTGTTPEQMEGWGWQSVHDPEALPKVLEQWKRSIATGEPFDMEFPLRGADGRFRLFLTRIVPVKDGQGRVVRWFGTNTDVDRLKRVEEALRQSENKYRQLFQNMTEEVHYWKLVRDEQGRIKTWRVVDVNPAALKSWGRKSLEDTIGRLADEIFPGATTHYMPIIQKIMTEGVSQSYEDYFPPPVDKYFRFTSVPLGEYFITTGADITALKKVHIELERQVQERTAKLREAMSDLEHFSYTITHDMRAPLRAIQGFSELMGELCGECIRSESKEYLELIKTSSARMDRLITDALQFGRTMQQPLPLKSVDAAALLRGIIQAYPNLKPPGARIQIEGEIPPVCGNEAGLTQCFSNLLGNAVKFVQPGTVPEVRIWAEQRSPAAGASETPASAPIVRIWFEDNGIGIPSQAQGHLFQMFQRATTEFEGSGIGLALVKKVVQRMGGSVGVESEEGRGSRFWIELGRNI